MGFGQFKIYKKQMANKLKEKKIKLQQLNKKQTSKLPLVLLIN